MASVRHSTQTNLHRADMSGMRREGLVGPFRRVGNVPRANEKGEYLRQVEYDCFESAVYRPLNGAEVVRTCACTPVARDNGLHDR